MSEQAPFKINDYWHLISLPTRNRWWKETDYGRIPPSAELEQVIVAEALAAFSGVEKK